MVVVRDSSEPSRARPVGGRDGLCRVGGRRPALRCRRETVARYTLAVLGATDLLKSAANKATVCLLAGSAVSFRCLQNWWKR